MADRAHGVGVQYHLYVRIVDTGVGLATVKAMSLSRLALVAVAASGALLLSACGSSTSSTASSAPASSSAASSTASESGAPMDDHLHTIGDGTSPTAGPFLLTVNQVPPAGSSGDLVLTIETEEGPVTDFAEAHTKKMHLLLTPEDLSTVVHVHPEPTADGTWVVPVEFPFGGSWRMVADVAEDMGEGELQYYALGEAIEVEGKEQAAKPIPEPTDFVEVDGFAIDLEGSLSATEHGTLMVTITRDGRMVDLEDYMGAKAHLIAFDTETYAYAHQHPSGGHDHGAGDGHGSDDHSDMADMGSMLHFETEFPQAGTYVFFLQFQVDGKVHTASFTGDVA